ncbi:bacteriocin [Streptococcus pluranimalium]
MTSKTPKTFKILSEKELEKINGGGRRNILKEILDALHKSDHKAR